MAETIKLKGLFNKKQKLNFSNDKSLNLERPMKAKEISRTLSYDNPNLQKVTDMLSNDDDLQMLVSEHKQLFSALAKIPTLTAENIFSILSAAEKEISVLKPFNDESESLQKIASLEKEDELKGEIEKLKKESIDKNILINQQREAIENYDQLQKESIKDKNEKQSLFESVLKLEQELEKNKVVIETLNVKVKAADQEREKLSKKLEMTQNENKSLGPLKELLLDKTNDIETKNEDYESSKFTTNKNKEIALLINEDRKNVSSEQIHSDNKLSPILADTFKPKDLGEEFGYHSQDDSMKKIKDMVMDLKSENRMLSTKLKEADEKIMKLTQNFNPPNAQIAENMDQLCTKLLNLAQKQKEELPHSLEQKTSYLLQLVDDLYKVKQTKPWHSEMKVKRYSDLKSQLIDMSFEIDTLHRKNEQMRKEKLLDETNLMHENEYNTKLEQLSRLKKDHDSMLIEFDLLLTENFRLKEELDQQKSIRKDLVGNAKEKELEMRMHIQNEVSEVKSALNLELARAKVLAESSRAQVGRLLEENMKLMRDNSWYAEDIANVNAKLTKYKKKYFKIKGNNDKM